MGRPKLPRTKEQIAIRLAPGTKERLEALVKAWEMRHGEKPIRSELIREALDEGLRSMEVRLTGTQPTIDPPARVPPPAAQAMPPPARVNPFAPRTQAGQEPARRNELPARREVPIAPPSQPRVPVAAPTLQPRTPLAVPAAPPLPRAPVAAPVAAPPQPRAPAPAFAHSSDKPMPGTLADRAWKRLQEMSAGNTAAIVSLPRLCRAVWPPNPAKVHDAIRELADRGYVELLAPEGEVPRADQSLVMRNPDGELLGALRLR